MAVKWTKEQEQVIGLRNRNILVSAAAGSGKTAVLVQRILGKVMDPEHPVDIDRLLIMTLQEPRLGRCGSELPMPWRMPLGKIRRTSICSGRLL